MWTRAHDLGGSSSDFSGPLPFLVFDQSRNRSDCFFFHGSSWLSSPKIVGQSNWTSLSIIWCLSQELCLTVVICFTFSIFNILICSVTALPNPGDLFQLFYFQLNTTVMEAKFELTVIGYLGLLCATLILYKQYYKLNKTEHVTRLLMSLGG